MKKSILIFLIILIGTYVFSAYGTYKITKIKRGESFNIPTRHHEERWKYFNFFSKKNKPIVQIFIRVEIGEYKANVCRYIKNLTNSTIRFSLVFEFQYILIKPYKIVRAANEALKPKCDELLLGGNYEAVDWGIAIYKKWINKNKNEGKGLIEHW